MATEAPASVVPPMVWPAVSWAALTTPLLTEASVGAAGWAGDVVSTVKVSAPLSALVLPAASVAVTAKLCAEPSVRVPIW